MRLARAVAAAWAVALAVAAVPAAAPAPSARVVYVGPRVGDPDACALFAVGIDGRNRRAVTGGRHECDYAPRWSPDGARVAFTRYSRNDPSWVEVVVRHVVTGRESTVPPWAQEPKWSPDGRLIAFQVPLTTGSGGRVTNGPTALSVVRPDGSRLRRVVEDAALNFTHTDIPVGGFWSWTPDGRSLLFTEGALAWTGGPPRVATVDVATGVVTVMTEGEQPAPSPDGRRIAFVREGEGLFVMSSDGRGVRRLVRGPDLLLPSWSHDGRRIAYVAYERNQLRVIGTRGGASKTIAKGDFVGRVSWLEGDRHVVAGTDTRVLVVQTDGGGSRVIANGSLPDVLQ